MLEGPLVERVGVDAELVKLFESSRLRGWERVVAKITEALIALGCLGFCGLVGALLAGFRPEPHYLLVLPALPVVVALLDGLANRRVGPSFEKLQCKLGQAPLGGYVRGQKCAMTVALRVLYLPHGDHVFVRARLDFDQQSWLDYCRGPLLRLGCIEPEAAGQFEQFQRSLDEDEFAQLFDLLRQPLDKVPSQVKDGAACQLVIDDGEREVFRTGANLSDQFEEEPDTVALARLLLKLAEGPQPQSQKPESEDIPVEKAEDHHEQQ